MSLSRKLSHKVEAENYNQFKNHIITGGFYNGKSNAISA